MIHLYQEEKMTEVFKETNNEVDEYTTKYFARAMQNQNLDSLI